LTFKKLNLSFFTIFQYNIYIFILLTNVSTTLFNISHYFMMHSMTCGVNGQRY